MPITQLCCRDAGWGHWRRHSLRPASERNHHGSAPSDSGVQTAHCWKGRLDSLCYECFTRTAPSYLCHCLQHYTLSCTLRSTSDTLSLQIPRTRLSTVGFHAFSVFGPSTWNDLPLSLRQKPSLDSFKCNLKTFFLLKTVDLQRFLFCVDVFVHLKSLFAAHFKLCEF